VTWAFRTWLTWAEAFGLGELRLTPDPFWRLTPREFELMQDGFFRREDRAWERIATLGLWVLAPYSKKKLTPAQLLGRSRLKTLPTRPVVEGASEADPGTADLEAAERARVLAQAMAWAED
jgi:uncharacterized phage protein (TIGR02216 family)